MPVTDERHRIEPPALEGLDVKVMRGAAAQRAVRVHVDQDRGDLQQRIGGGS